MVVGLDFVVVKVKMVVFLHGWRLCHPHEHGHVGCSSGYNLDMYIAYKDLNSQVNEQANAGLQHIKSLVN